MACETHSLMRAAWVLAAALGVSAGARADAPKPSVSFSHYASGTVYPGGPKQDTNVTRAEVNVDGSEKRVCSPNPATYSTASALTSAQNQRNDGGITEFDVNLYLAAKGGKFPTCFKCDGPQLCVEPGPDEVTSAEASASLTATLTYRFPDTMRGAGSFWFRVRALNAHGLNPGGALDVAMYRLKRPGEVKVKLDEQRYLDLMPGEELSVTIKLSGFAMSKGPTETYKDQVGAKIRVEMAEGAILESSQVEGFILNGKETQSFRSVGLIAQVDKEGALSAHCTGTVVGNRSILTAAHCVGDLKMEQVVSEGRLLFLATDNILNASNPMIITGFAYPKGELPEKFNFRERNNMSLEDDVAILYTERPIGLQAMQLLAPPPAVEDIAQQAKAVTFVGFGLNPSPTTASRASGIKREASGPITNADNRTFLVSAQRTGASTCRGDSGGPSLIQDRAGIYKILGITSYGAQNCQSGYNMKVDAYSTWIERHIQ